MLITGRNDYIQAAADSIARFHMTGSVMNVLTFLSFPSVSHSSSRLRATGTTVRNSLSHLSWPCYELLNAVIGVLDKAKAGFKWLQEDPKSRSKLVCRGRIKIEAPLVG
jgi:hypothetical protein